MPPAVIPAPLLRQGSDITLHCVTGVIYVGTFVAMSQLGIVIQRHTKPHHSFFPFANIVEVEF